MEVAVNPIKIVAFLTNKCVIYINVRQGEFCIYEQMDFLKHSSGSGFSFETLLHIKMYKVLISCLWSILIGCFGILVFMFIDSDVWRYQLTTSLSSMPLTKSSPVFKSNVMDRSLLIEQYELARQQPDGLDSFREGRFHDIVLQWDTLQCCTRLLQCPSFLSNS